MSTTHEELASFNRFATEQIDDNGSNLSLDEIYGLWRLNNPSPSEREEVNVIIRQGLADMKAGRGRDAEEVGEELRQKYGIPAE